MSRRRARSSSRPSHCIFCGAQPPLSGEHIFGDWLRKLGNTGEGVREIIPGDGSEPIIQRGGMFSKKLKIVCSACNSEWMSQLEEAAKPLLVRMFSLPFLPYQHPQIVLDTSDQVALARWAFKTVVIAAYVGRRETFPAPHCKEFCSTSSPPQHVQIWTGTASVPNHPIHGEHLAEAQFQPMELNTSSPDGSTIFPGYKSHLRLFNVVFVVMGYVADTDIARFDPSKDLRRMLTPLWPPNQDDVVWPPPANVDKIGGMSVLEQLPGISA
ncbi:hypothetical protein [Mycobacterium helveticum]|jgi:hypothetical protein|uniref:Uncharacterized protein n=1 Tax=Mycobacterium helveticum TaxID=2592811 RepID=A0A557XVG4_9MYCO|nr:hypothetical protein [Mycobacterium helveticum]TVS86044.1 hypothetical protein FPZ46_12650 [Mycobacterium helveticum]TVS90017.1 hypothetical protein FPZ47_10795 [Mycobacterium helveticum]